MSSQIVLQSISLRNFATFENQVVEFSTGFNGIIGETGSGKSLILDAFELILGNRADKKVIRKGSSSAIIEGVFSVHSEGINGFFEELGFPIEEDQIVIKRIIDKNGKSKAYLNHLLCPVSTLTLFAKSFIDLVGQFENQRLLSPDYQTLLLDNYAQITDLVSHYQNLYQDLHRLRTKKIELEEKQKSGERQKDYLQFQLKELNSYELSSHREQELIEKKNQFMGRDDALKAQDALNYLLSESDHSILTLLRKVQKETEILKPFLEQEGLSLIEELSEKAQEFSYVINQVDLQEFEDGELEEVLNELDHYQKLKRKYHLSTDELISKKEEFERELNELQDVDGALKEIKAQIEKAENECFLLAKKISSKRSEKSLKLSSEMTKALQKLNMKGSTFEVSMTQGQKLQSHGIDLISFQVETNKGEGFYKINDIASGGELSRILLCLRQLVSSNDSISVFFFDEIDTGIGGETAKKIAEALKKVSQDSQVVAITHLPQIAKLVDHIIYVDKKTVKSGNQARTFSFVEDFESLDRDKIIQTLAGV